MLLNPDFSELLFFHLATIAPGHQNGGFPPLRHHRLVAGAVGRLYLANEIGPLSTPTFEVGASAVVDLEAEAQTVTWLSQQLSKLPPRLRVVTFYGTRFDFPVAVYRALRLGIRMPVPTSLQHDDVAVLTSVGTSEVQSLGISDCAELVGLPRRPQIDVYSRFELKDLDGLQGSVAVDLLITACVYLRFLLVDGILTRQEFSQLGRVVMQSLYDRFDLVKEYVKLVNVRKFLFAPPKKS